MEIPERMKHLLLSGASVLGMNLIFQRSWGSIILGVTITIVGGIVLPPLVTFMTNEQKDNRYK